MNFCCFAIKKDRFMEKTKNFLAVDYGASNGRAIIGEFDGKKLQLIETHRFENQPVYLTGTLYWDILRLFHELKVGIIKTLKKYNQIESIGIDTWGCDFGLLDEKCNLISNPAHYRDKRTLGLMETVRKIISDKELYEKTQAQIIEINTIYQLYSITKNNLSLLNNSRYLLFMGDLFNYFLTGEKICEYSNATLSQLYNQRDKKWEKSLISLLGIPEQIFIETTDPGNIIGLLKKDLCEEMRCNPIKIALSCYDTTSEITAIPVSKNDINRNWCYLNCETWGMVGIISKYPIVTDEGFNLRFGNEGGFNEKYHYLKNVTALWIIQQCRRKWFEDEAAELGWDEIMHAAQTSPDNNIFIDVDDKVFEREIFDMPSCIKKYCKDTGQNIPEMIGGISRVFYESLALKYAHNIKCLEKITGKKIEIVNLVGGGSKDRLICQYIANAAELNVIAGPAETTTAGNIIVQMYANNEIKDINEGRQLILESVKLKTYEPKEIDKWHEKFGKYKKILGTSI